MQAILRMVDEGHRRIAPNPIEMVLREERTVEAAVNILLLRNDGAEIPMMQSAAPIRDRSGAIVGVVLVLHDVSRERQYVAKLSYQASHDALTGLINRAEFERRLGLALESAAQIGRHHAVMYLDLDQFKVVNDTCGHAAGDELMRQVSHVLRRACARATRWRGSAATSSACCSRTARRACRADRRTLRQTVMDFHFAWSERSFNDRRQHRLVNVDDGLLTLADVLERRRRGVLHGQGKGPQPRAGLPSRGQRTRRAPGRDGMGGAHPTGARRRIVSAFTPRTSSCSGPGLTRTERTASCCCACSTSTGELVPPMAFIPAAERYNLMPAIDAG